MDWVLERLEELELEPPEKGAPLDAESHGEELLSRVLGRAHEILSQWYGDEIPEIEAG